MPKLTYKKSGMLFDSMSLSVVCLFAALVMGVVALGGSALRQTQQGLDDAYDCTVASSYLRTQLLQRSGKVLVITQDEVGQVLVITKQVGSISYETRIFLWNGYLRESFVASSTAFSPSMSAEIIQLQALRFELQADGLFTAQMQSGNATAIDVAVLLEEPSTHANGQT